MDSFSKLLRGYEKFRESLTQEAKEDFKQLANGQSPGTLMITCSDSRVDPHLFTSAEPGELFVVRNAGNIVPDPENAHIRSDLGTIQFAVEVLGVNDIVVCGHSDCGAVKAMMNPESVSSLTFLKEWIEQTGTVAQVDQERSIQHNVRLNSLVQVDRLAALPAVADRMQAGDLRLHAWVFNIGEATLESFNFETASWQASTGQVDQEMQTSAV